MGLKNRRPCYLAQYTAKFFQGTKVKLNCTFFSITREKYLGEEVRKFASRKVRKIYAVRGNFVDVRHIKCPKDRSG